MLGREKYGPGYPTGREKSEFRDRKCLAIVKAGKDLARPEALRDAIEGRAKLIEVGLRRDKHHIQDNPVATG